MSAGLALGARSTRTARHHRDLVWFHKCVPFLVGVLHFFGGGGGGGSGHGKLAKPSHQMALERTLVFGTRENSRIQGSGQSNATIVPQSNVVAEITCNPPPPLRKHAQSGQMGSPCLGKPALARDAQYQTTHVCSESLPVPLPERNWIGLGRGHSPQEHDAQWHAPSACILDERNHELMFNSGPDVCNSHVSDRTISGGGKSHQNKQHGVARSHSGNVPLVKFSL